MKTTMPSRLETIQLPRDPDQTAPDGSELRLLPRVARGGLCHCTLHVGWVSKATANRTVDELWYCLSGTGEVWRKNGDEEQIGELTPGTALSLPRGTVFQFRNTGDVPLCLLIATMPPWPGSQEAREERGVWSPLLASPT